MNHPEQKTINNHLKPVMIIGGYPPPTGGVTVHIQRFYEYCQNHGQPARIVTQFDHAPNSDIIALKGNKLVKLFHLMYLIARFPGEIIHVHAAGFNMLLYAGVFIELAGIFKYKVLTVHSGISAFPEMEKGIKYRIIKWLLSGFNHIICINKNQKQFFNANYAVPKKKMRVIPSFIPIQDTQFIASETIREFTEKIRSKVDYLLVCAGYLNRIYTYETLFEAVKQLPQYRLGIVLLIYQQNDPEYAVSIENTVADNKHIWLLKNFSSEDFFYVIKSSDILVRTNYEDTYGMVIGDAIDLDTPAIASDVCKRDERAIIFKTGDINDLTAKIQYTLMHLSEIKKSFHQADNPDYAGQVVDFYREITKS